LEKEFVFSQVEEQVSEYFLNFGRHIQEQ